MPRGVYSRKPAEGGSIGGGEASPSTSINDQIKQMTGFASPEEMAESLPENTMTAPIEEDRPRKKRRTKEEMAASRGESTSTTVELDPLMQDERYKKIVEKMRGKTLTTTVVKGFDVAAKATEDPEWHLEKDEVGEVDDISYILAKRYPVLDPTNHWLSMAVYSLAVLGGLIFKRAGKAAVGSGIQKLMAMLGGDEEEAEPKKEGAVN